MNREIKAVFINHYMILYQKFATVRSDWTTPRPFYYLTTAAKLIC